MKKLTTVNVAGHQHVICDFEELREKYEQPNYRGTGKAFCGVLLKNETLKDFKKRSNSFIKDKVLPKTDVSVKKNNTKYAKCDFCGATKNIYKVGESKKTGFVLSICKECSTTIDSKINQ